MTRPSGRFRSVPSQATLTPDAVVLLAEFLSAAEEPTAHIRIVGEAAAPALALDRARAVD